MFPFKLLPNDSAVFGELTLSNICNDALGSASAYIRNCEASNVACHPVYDHQGVSLEHTLQLIPVDLVRLDESPALMGHCIVGMLSSHDDSDLLKPFISVS